jgi:hypothetical protein
LALYLNKLEFHSPQDNLYQVWLNLVSLFLRRLSKFFSAFLFFCYCLSLGEGVSPSFEQTWTNPFPPRMRHVCARAG